MQTVKEWQSSLLFRSKHLMRNNFVTISTLMLFVGIEAAVSQESVKWPSVIIGIGIGICAFRLLVVLWDNYRLKEFLDYNLDPENNFNASIIKKYRGQNKVSGFLLMNYTALDRLQKIDNSGNDDEMSDIGEFRNSTPN